MSALDKDSGVREVPVPRCPACHCQMHTTAAGLAIHTDPRSTCRG